MNEIWKVSTNGVLHLIDNNGYYWCNKAVGKARGNTVTEHKQFPEIKCKHCLRMLGLE